MGKTVSSFVFFSAHSLRPVYIIFPFLKPILFHPHNIEVHPWHSFSIFINSIEDRLRAEIATLEMQLFLLHVTNMFFLIKVNWVNRFNLSVDPFIYGN